MTKKKKTMIIVAAVVLVLAIAAGLFFLLRPGAGNAQKVFVMSVAEITGGIDPTGANNRYSGVTESQETLEIKIDQGRTVQEIFVEVGQEVEVGDKLFSYVTSDIALQLEQAKLEIDRMNQSIATNKTEIAQLEAERANAPAEQQLEYTLQIQSLQQNIKSTEYNIKAKQLEYDQLSKSYNNSVVTATMAGSVKSINDPDSYDPNSGMSQSDAFMVIMRAGDFVVKGTVSELNVYSLYKDMPVLVRSRIDETQTWTGIISSVDTSQPQSNNNDMYYGYGSDTGNTGSKYTFYVELDTTDGLILGQHVTIEPDFGQGGISNDLKLGSYYILDIDTTPYVWAANDKDKLEKRYVTLGEYDADMDSYVIEAGLGYEDYIAFPEETLREGMTTTREYEIPEIDDPGFEDPGYEDPGFTDPGMEDPGFEGGDNGAIPGGDGGGVEIMPLGE